MIHKSICSNGVRIVHEKMPHMRSVALGIWVEAGSANELEEEAGIAHFIEHMLFKGTTKRTARMIAEEFDRLGGDLNAFTSKEVTCYYTTVLSDHAEKALLIMEDMFYQSKFDEEEIEKEKSVVLEEIATVEDTPDDDVHEQLWQAMYPTHAIGKPILGTEKTISTFTKSTIDNFMKRYYRPERIVISVAGNYNEALIRLIEKLFGTQKSGLITPQKEVLKIPKFEANDAVKIKEIEQVHLCLGFPSLKLNDERMYEQAILDSIFGGAMSSRLFQEVREERGLAYSIYSYYTSYVDAGAFIIYGGTSIEKAQTLKNTIQQAIEKIVMDGPTHREIENAREQVKGSFLLGLESTESRMYRNGNNEVLFGQHKTIQEVVDSIYAVEGSSVKDMAHSIFNHKPATSTITPE